MKKHRLFIIVFSLLLAFVSCRKDKFSNLDTVDFKVSTDTVYFDTVFSTVGSITKRLKIINPHRDKIMINHIGMENGNLGFRLNINGNKGNHLQDVEVLGNDSIYVFIEVTVKPGDVNEPFVKEEKLIIQSRNYEKEVMLVAWGQDAYFFRNALISGNNLAFPNDKPIVFYGINLIDSAADITIQEGSQIHFHPRAALVVYKQASLKILGTVENPVMIQGDRLEMNYRERAGQWDRIWFFATSKDNVIENTVIKNGNIGIQVDSVGGPNPTLRLKNVFIRNMSGLGILAQGSSIEAENCIVANCGQYLAALVYGGDYSFKHCTFANYWNQSGRSTPSIVLNNFFESNTGAQVNRPLKKAFFGNCIIDGNNEDEILLDNGNQTDFNYLFDHCAIKYSEEIPEENFINILKNEPQINRDGTLGNPFFTDHRENDYSLIEQSPAKGKGSPSIAAQVPADFEGKNRKSIADLGAIEFQP